MVTRSERYKQFDLTATAERNSNGQWVGHAEFDLHPYFHVDLSTLPLQTFDTGEEALTEALNHLKKLADRFSK